MIYGSCDIECDRLLSFWTIFFPFSSPNNLKNQNYEKMKKMCRDIILYKCTKTENHDVWFLRYGAQQIFFVILDYFLPFYRRLSLSKKTTQKSKFRKNEKKTWRYFNFANAYHKQQ